MDLHCMLEFANMLFPPWLEQPMLKWQKVDGDAHPVQGQPLVLQHVTMEGKFGSTSGGSSGHKKKTKAPKEQLELSIPCQIGDQLVYDSFELLSNLADDLQPLLHFVLPL